MRMAGRSGSGLIRIELRKGFLNIFGSGTRALMVQMSWLVYWTGLVSNMSNGMAVGSHFERVFWEREICKRRLGTEVMIYC